MDKAFASTLDMSLREQVNMRTAAYLLAVQRVADATSVRGCTRRSPQLNGQRVFSIPWLSIDIWMFKTSSRRCSRRLPPSGAELLLKDLAETRRTSGLPVNRKASLPRHGDSD